MMKVAFFQLTYFIGSFAATLAFFVETIQTISKIVKGKPNDKNKESQLLQDHINVVFYPFIAL